jgi:hypothetical protein
MPGIKPGMTDERRCAQSTLRVMAGFIPAIHVFLGERVGFIAPQPAFQIHFSKSIARRACPVRE